MAVDETDLPFVMPASVPRVKADGKPTTFLIDWEEGTRNWYYTNAVNTDKRITEVKSQTDQAIASFTEDIQALTDADNAMVQQITTLTASTNAATATGQIFFAAKAGPAGSAAAYGLYLTAGSTYTGLEAVAMSDGTSVIGLTASKFVFTDSGTAEQVFTYTGGQFVLTGNVSINGNLVVNGTVVTDKIADNAITNIATGEGDHTGASCPIFARAGDRILVTVTYSPNAKINNNNVTDASPVVRLNSNAGTQKVVKVFRSLRAQSIANDGTVSNAEYFWNSTTRQILFIAPSTGTHTITAGAMGQVNEIDVFISAVAYSK